MKERLATINVLVVNMYEMNNVLWKFEPWQFAGSVFVVEDFQVRRQVRREAS